MLLTKGIITYPVALVTINNIKYKAWLGTVTSNSYASFVLTNKTGTKVIQKEICEI